MTAVVTIEAVVIGLLCLLVFGLLRSHGEILRALHDLGVNLGEEEIGPSGSVRPDSPTRARRPKPPRRAIDPASSRPDVR